MHIPQGITTDMLLLKGQISKVTLAAYGYLGQKNYQQQVSAQNLKEHVQFEIEQKKSYELERGYESSSTQRIDRKHAIICVQR